MKITSPSKKEIKAMQSLYKKLHEIETQIKNYKKEVCTKRCPLNSFDTIQLPDGSEGIVLSCEAYADYSRWELEYPCYDKIEFRIRYFPVRGKRVLKETRVTRKWREIVVLERDWEKAREMVRKRHGVTLSK